MSKMLLIMHHIALCNPCIAHIDLVSYLCIRYITFSWSRRSEREYGGPQASSVVDSNIIVIKASPGASNSILEFCFS
jgi:hypothetical protein